MHTPVTSQTFVELKPNDGQVLSKLDPVPSSAMVEFPNTPTTSNEIGILNFKTPPERPTTPVKEKITEQLKVEKRQLPEHTCRPPNWFCPKRFIYSYMNYLNYIYSNI